MPSDYRSLDVWKLAHVFVIDIKKDFLTDIPEEEKFTLKQQIWRAAYSITLNIAEGTGRSTDKDYISFLHNAFGSAKEIEYCLLLVKDLGYITEEKYNKYQEKLTRIQKMLSGLIRSLRKVQ